MSSDLFESVKDIVELKMVKDYVALENDNGDPNLQLIHERFQNKDGLILLYSPTCPWCKKMVPAFTQLSQIVKDQFPLGAINCLDDSNGNDILGDYFRVSGYPTIKYYKNGKYIDYTGGREVKDFLNFLCKTNKLCNF